MAVLDGKVALITGAARGQGAAMARLFRAEGATVVASDRRPPEAGDGPEDAAAEIVLLDIAEEADWARTVDAILARHGRLDILVNNAAVFAPRPFAETDAAELDAHYRVNQRGTFLGMRAATRVMREAGGGAIVNIGSVAALSGSEGAFAYTATKWALRGMTRSAARELAADGVRVNAVLPGLIDTDMARANPPERNVEILAAVPLARIGQPADIAGAALFLASDAAAYMTGAEIVVDGGIMA
jgi:3alpha(or 20beta)-hydroxysteroid dehydrogenase